MTALRIRLIVEKPTTVTSFNGKLKASVEAGRAAESFGKRYLSEEEIRQLAEQRSIDRWQETLAGADPSPVLYFGFDSVPPELEDDGRYIGFIDFKNVQRRLGASDIPLTTLYHELVCHFSKFDQIVSSAAYSLLRANPNNRSSWNEFSHTYEFHILGDLLVDYSEHSGEAQRKIGGVGKFGNRAIREVLEIDDGFDEQLGY